MALSFKSSKVEFRGSYSKTSKKGNTYNMANFEEVGTGRHHEQYVPEHLVPVLNEAQKGDCFNLFFDYNNYGKLDLVDVRRAD